MNRPVVSVGIITRDRAKSLAKAIASALDQRGANIHVAVIDDGSRDATTTLPARFPEVTWRRHEVSTGYVSARNELMRWSGFDYFASLDDDAWFMKGDEVATAVEYLEKNKSVAAVAFDILSRDRPQPTARELPRVVAMFIGCGHVLRLSAVRSIGMYENSPGSYGGEEKDLCLRLMDAGYQIIRLPGVHVWHDKTPIAREQPAQHRSGVCNDLVMTLRRTPTFLLPVAILAKLYRHSKFSLQHELMRPCLQGFSLFARSIPAALKTRRAVRIATLRKFVQLSRTS